MACLGSANGSRSLQSQCVVRPDDRSCTSIRSLTTLAFSIIIRLTNHQWSGLPSTSPMRYLPTGLSNPAFRLPAFLGVVSKFILEPAGLNQSFQSSAAVQLFSTKPLGQSFVYSSVGAVQS